MGIRAAPNADSEALEMYQFECHADKSYVDSNTV